MRKLGKLKIRQKLVIMFLIVLSLITFVTLFTSWYEYQKDAKKQVSDFSMQTLNALDNSLQLIVNHVEQESYTLFWNPLVQDILKNIGEEDPTPQNRATVKESLINMMLSGDFISSIILYDEYGNSYDCLRSGSMVKRDIDITKMPWYDSVVEMDGQFKFVVNAGVADYYPDGNVLSMIKVLKSQEDYSRLGIVVVNIGENAVRHFFDDIGKEFGTSFYVMDGDQILFGPKEDSFQDMLNVAISKGETQPEDVYIEMDGEKYFANSIKSQVDNWTIVSITPVRNIKLKTTMNLTLFLLVVNILVVLLGGEYIRNILSKPLKEMENHIALDEKGFISPMEVDENSCDEISELKRVYNKMQFSIEQLMEKTKSDAQVIRKNEVDLLRAQLNPHFLYNTLDAISAMALIGDQDNCFKMTRALAMFYRDTLSRGSDCIPISGEIKCIVNYLTIINMRSDAKIETEYDLEEGIENEMVLKLLLQPFVENSALHGLRGKDGGKIKITVKRDGEWLSFLVWDNGEGMTQKDIQEVLTGKKRTGKSGFGVYGALERIRLFYGVEEPVSIYSEPGKFTQVEIKVRRMKDKSNGNQSINC